jgi:hypothetical protein
MQTRVYPFLLAALSAQSNSEFKLTPDQIEMIYWYPAFPDSAVQFAYSNSQFLEDEKYLLAMIQEIEHLNESGFTKTENERLCSYCRYRSLCNRGISAGNRHDSDDLQTDDESAFDIDFDQILPAE